MKGLFKRTFNYVNHTSITRTMFVTLGFLKTFFTFIKREVSESKGSQTIHIGNVEQFIYATANQEDDGHINTN